MKMNVEDKIKDLEETVTYLADQNIGLMKSLNLSLKKTEDTENKIKSLGEFYFLIEI